MRRYVEVALFGASCFLEALYETARHKVVPWP